jgi:hypothetical protein
MDKHFEILFLDEAYEFLGGLERKQYVKILYNIRKSQVELDPGFSKSSQTTFGNLGRFIRVNNFDCLLFGTKLQQWTHWLFRQSDLSKKEVKFQITKFKKQLSLEQNIGSYLF